MPREEKGAAAVAIVQEASAVSIDQRRRPGAALGLVVKVAGEAAAGRPWEKASSLGPSTASAGVVRSKDTNPDAK